MKEQILQTCQDAQANLELVLYVLGGVAAVFFAAWAYWEWSQRRYERRLERRIEDNWRNPHGYV